jgi:hypothetical protein
MTHVLQVLFLSVFILQVVMHGEESQVPGDFVALRCLRMGKIYIITDKYVINTSYFPLQQANCARYTQEQTITHSLVCVKLSLFFLIQC